MDEVHKALGLRIRGLRINYGLSQEQLAEKAGMSQKHLGKMERGDVNASIQSLTSIANALGMSLRDILETEHEQSKENLLKELFATLPELSVKDVQIVYRLVRVLSGR